MGGCRRDLNGYGRQPYIQSYAYKVFLPITSVHHYGMVIGTGIACRVSLDAGMQTHSGCRLLLRKLSDAEMLSKSVSTMHLPCARHCLELHTNESMARTMDMIIVGWVSTPIVQTKCRSPRRSWLYRGTIFVLDFFTVCVCEGSATFTRSCLASHKNDVFIK